ncbi:hypothetical protein BpHYR1_005304, partial [Brachionus plicatilis]
RINLTLQTTLIIFCRFRIQKRHGTAAIEWNLVKRNRTYFAMINSQVDSLSSKFINQLEKTIRNRLKMQRLAVFVNGEEKYASGITKDTIVDDIKFAMLSASVPDFTPDKLDDYGVFERCQSNEKLLDGRTKMYKIIKTMNHEQFGQIRFLIKQKIQKKKTNSSKSEFKLCSLSPTIGKTWNRHKAVNEKSSFIRKQLKQMMCQNDTTDEPKDAEKRFATIRKLNTGKKWSVAKTNLNLNKQLERINELKCEMKLMNDEFRSSKKNCQFFEQKKMLESLEFQLKQLEIQQMERKTSSSSIVSTDSGFSSCTSSSDDEDEIFYKLSTFETLKTSFVVKLQDRSTY